MGTVGARGSSLAISRAEMPQKRRAQTESGGLRLHFVSLSLAKSKVNGSQRATHLSESWVRWGCLCFALYEQQEQY